jgi:hypothetical protein
LALHQPLLRYLPSLLELFSLNYLRNLLKNRRNYTLFLTSKITI